MSYYTEDGKIDEAVYGRVLENVVNKKCPHVDDVCDKYVTETGIYAIHIAAVVGTDKAISEHLRHCKSYFPPSYKNITSRLGKLFRLGPYDLAMIKKSNRSCTLYCKTLNRLGSYRWDEGGRTLIYAYKMQNVPMQIKFDLITVLELIIKMKHTALLKCVVGSDGLYTGVDKIVNLILRNNLPELHDALLKYISWLVERDEFVSTLFGAANHIQLYVNKNVPYELPELTRTLIKLLEQNDKERNNKIMTTLKEIPVNHKTLIQILCTCKDEFMDTLKANPSILHALQLPDYGLPLLHFCIDHVSPQKCTNVLRRLLDLGVDIDSVDLRDHTPLLFLLRKGMEVNAHSQSFREAIELFIYENSNADLNKSAVFFGIEVDEYMESRTQLESDMKGEHFLDGKEHNIFDHSESFALNFLGPLLIECGFPVSRDLLLWTLDRKSVHRKEYDYMQQCLDTPRQLALRCRDVLRKHFGGRALHRYLENADIPQKIKDFILIKSILINI